MRWPWPWFSDGRIPRAYWVHRIGGPTNAPIGPNYTKILTLTVPAGSYAVFGKTGLQTAGGTQSGADCQLAYDDGSGEMHPDRTSITPGAGKTGGTSAAVHNLEALITAKNTATIWIHARATATWDAVDSKLIAIEVEVALDQEVTA
jgi:hypothetical protein